MRSLGTIASSFAIAAMLASGSALIAQDKDKDHKRDEPQRRDNSQGERQRPPQQQQPQVQQPRVNQPQVQQQPQSQGQPNSNREYRRSNPSGDGQQQQQQ